MLLQLITVSLIVFKFFSEPQPWLINPAKEPFHFFYPFLCFSLFVALLGLSGSLIDNTEAAVPVLPSVLFEQLISSAAVQFLTLVFQLIYYLYLPTLLISKSKHFRFFFAAFFTLFAMHIVLGTLDLIANLQDINLLPRFVFGDNTYAKFRFNGLAGEPRDVLPLHILALGLLLCWRIFNDDLEVGRRLVLVVLAPVLLTGATSSLIAITLFLVLYSALVFYREPSKIIRDKSSMVFVGSVVFSLFLVATMYPRVTRHVSGIFAFFMDLFSGNGHQFNNLAGQVNNFFPIIEYLRFWSEANLLGVFFGAGLGASAIVNSFSPALNYEMIFPNAQIVRMIYETGLVGVVIFVWTFGKVARWAQAFMTPTLARYLPILFLLTISSYFAHRNDGFLIFFGLLIATLSFCQKSKKTMIHQET